MVFEWSLLEVRTHFPFPCVCVFVSQKKKKKKILIKWGVVNQDPLDVGTFPCRGDLWLAFLRFYGVFSIRGRYECVAKS